MTQPFESPVYRKWIRWQECVVCAKLRGLGVRLEFRHPVLGVVECAHVGDHGKGQKCSDLETLSLCAWHHRIAPDSHHVLGARFWSHHRLNRQELIDQFQKDFYADEGARVA